MIHLHTHSLVDILQMFKFYQYWFIHLVRVALTRHTDRQGDSYLPSHNIVLRDIKIKYRIRKTSSREDVVIGYLSPWRGLHWFSLYPRMIEVWIPPFHQILYIQGNPGTIWTSLETSCGRKWSCWKVTSLTGLVVTEWERILFYQLIFFYHVLCLFWNSKYFYWISLQSHR